MSWYSSPVRPIDPIVESQQPKPPIRYVRDNFNGTGQNSYVKAPAQDQSQWQALNNVMPITQGVLNPRWGYNFIDGFLGSQFVNRLYNFQSDATGVRAIIEAGSGGVTAINEAGSIYNTGIFTPSSTNPIRSVTSRNYQYFCDGNNALNTSTHLTGDSLKWDGSASGGVTNIGISTVDVTPNSASGGGSLSTFTQGPNTGTVVTDIPAATPVPWQNPPGIFSNNLTLAAWSPIYVGVSRTDALQATGFFGSITTGTNVQGIQVTFNYQEVTSSGATGTTSIVAQLVKNGNPIGSTHTGALTIDGLQHTLTLGGPNDTWGGTFVPSDLSGTGFGVIFYVTGNISNPGTNRTIRTYISYVTITATLTSTTATTTNSGLGVGITGVAAVTSGINLTIGRIYYLVGNNSRTGHFSDLTPPSSSTGPLTNQEVDLALATFNDPQVDFKYLLATADGGDPSILYEVQPLVPGLVITSWAINGANVVTFTGTYSSSQYVTGNTVVIGGLSHGNYMNGQTLTVTTSSPTTFSANFTHGADSATEGGVAGNYTFAIPNAVTFVVDNTTDPNLVLNQPLLFTDQFGEEFGVTLNDPPPAGTLLCKHQGRLWMAGVSGATHSVFFTKSVTELTLPNGFIAGKYEESWPGSNYFDVSDGAESVAGLLSDGQTLYIGTQSHIRRLLGNSPVNFQEPQIVHPQVGLINQEVWQVVYFQGAPSGCIWMTPDFRVMQSDFNTYVDIGNPIQDILNNLQPTAASLAHAAFVADGEFNLYILAVPYKQSTYCDTHLVFDMKSRQWFVWQPASGSLSILYNVSASGVPQWWFVGGLYNTVGFTKFGTINLYSSTATTDALSGTVSVPIPVSATTTWLHLGEPTRRKMLNELQIYGNTQMTMNVSGSNNLADFTATPRPIVYNRALKMSPFGTWNLYLTGAKTRHRYYQFTFQGNASQSPFLGSYAIATLPLDDL